MYDLGRTTVHQATDMLVNEGYLERRRGIGTFVIKNHSDIATMELPELNRDTDNFEKQILKRKENSFQKTVNGSQTYFLITYLKYKFSIS